MLGQCKDGAQYVMCSARFAPNILRVNEQKSSAGFYEQRLMKRLTYDFATAIRKRNIIIRSVSLYKMKIGKKWQKHFNFCMIRIQTNSKFSINTDCTYIFITCPCLIIISIGHRQLLMINKLTAFGKFKSTVNEKLKLNLI